MWMLAILTLSLLPLLAADEPAGVRFQAETGQVEILAGAAVVLSSPPEGLWSIACDWRNGWPADWHNIKPSGSVSAGEWTVIRGQGEACGGTWLLEDAYRRTGRVIKGLRRFSWKGLKPAPKVTLAVRFQTLPAKTVPLLPGILYSGNPSGAKSGKVPVYTGTPGEQAIFEEHRFPMPFAFVELERTEGRLGAALHSLPSPVPYGNLKDQWWSLGLTARQDRTELLLLSGPCAANGRESVIKALQQGFKEYDSAWLNLPAEGVIEKTFFLDAFPVEREGSGFSRPLYASLDLFAPTHTGDMPTFAEIIRDKYRLAKSRWRETATEAGFKKYPDRDFFVMGWTGQAEALGYALQVLADGLHDPEALEMAVKSLDFLLGAKFFEGGFHNWYDFAKKEWTGNEPLNQGQAMLSFANAIRVGRRNKLDTSRGEAFLRKAGEFHANRILAAGWSPVSTAERSSSLRWSAAISSSARNSYSKRPEKRPGSTRSATSACANRIGAAPWTRAARTRRAPTERSRASSRYTR